MSGASWRVLGETEAGGVWAAVAEHPPVERLDRTHVVPQTTLSLWLSPQPNRSQGCFLYPGRAQAHAPIGRIVVMPVDMPLHVRSAAEPTRRLLQCRLPARFALSPPRDARSLGHCLDLRNPSVAANLTRLAREVTAPGFASATMIEGLGLQVAAELARDLAGSAVRAGGGLAPWQLRRIDDYILAGQWDCSVSDLAALCGISPGHAMRAFRQSRGRSIAAHVALLRIGHARDLLIQADDDIAGIAATLRFASPSAFSAAFRRATGETPNGFRQRMRAAS